MRIDNDRIRQRGLEADLATFSRGRFAVRAPAAIVAFAFAI